MISIKGILGKHGCLLVPCPKCNSGQLITEFGEQTCKYEKCDGHKFLFEFNFDTAKMLLEIIEKENKRISELPPAKEFRPAVPNLQKVNSGYILVPQPPTDNPELWYKK